MKRSQPPRRKKPIARSTKPLKRTPLPKSTKRLIRKALLKRGAPPRATGKSRFPKMRVPDYVEFIRGLPCLLLGRFRHGMPHDCGGYPVEATHLRSRGAGGEDVGNCLPIDGRAHREQHLIGIVSWAESWGFTVKELHRIAAEVYPREFLKAQALGWTSLKETD